jgi:sporadic carbohydrate cluster protein (TIGR04323 family)
MRTVRGYIFSRPFMGERVPQHVQNLVIRDYCERNKLQFLLSATEYAMPNSHLILAQVIDELAQIDGLVAYSLFQLPETPSRRHWVYDQAIVQRSGKTLHFAVEGLRVATVADCERIETLWQTRQTLAYCPQLVA